MNNQFSQNLQDEDYIVNYSHVVENLSNQGINSHFDGLFLGFEPFFQVIKFFGENQVIGFHTMLSNELCCLGSIRIFRVMDINDLTKITCYDSNSVFAHRSHHASHTSAFNFQISTFITYFNFVVVVTAAAFCQEFIDHIISPCFYYTAIPSTHPIMIIDQNTAQVKGGKP